MLRWQHLFSKQILSRGREYFHNNAVKDLQYWAGTYRAVVAGREKYSVRITTGGNKIRTMAYTKKDNGQDAREKEPVMEGTYTFTADSPDQEILCIYDGLEGEVRYKLLVNN